MIRDIVVDGQVIGTLELPDGTPEEVWAERLAAYANKPPAAPVHVVRLRRALRALDLTSTFDAILTDPDARDTWEYTVEFSRDTINAQLGNVFTEDFLDTLFEKAASL